MRRCAASVTAMTPKRVIRDVGVGGLVPSRDINLIAPIRTRYQEPGDTEKEDGKTASLSAGRTPSRTTSAGVPRHAQCAIPMTRAVSTPSRSARTCAPCSAAPVASTTSAPTTSPTRTPRSRSTRSDQASHPRRDQRRQGNRRPGAPEQYERNQAAGHRQVAENVRNQMDLRRLANSTAAEARMARWIHSPLPAFLFVGFPTTANLGVTRLRSGRRTAASPPCASPGLRPLAGPCSPSRRSSRSRSSDVWDWCRHLWSGWSVLPGSSRRSSWRADAAGRTGEVVDQIGADQQPRDEPTVSAPLPEGHERRFARRRRYLRCHAVLQQVPLRAVSSLSFVAAGSSPQAKARPHPAVPPARQLLDPMVRLLIWIAAAVLGGRSPAAILVLAIVIAPLFGWALPSIADLDKSQR